MAERTAEAEGAQRAGVGQSVLQRTGQPLPAPAPPEGFPPQRYLTPRHRRTLAGLGRGAKSGDAPFSPSSQGQEVQLVMSPETQELVEKQQMVGVLLQAERVPTNSYVGALTCEHDCRIVTLLGGGVFAEMIKLTWGL